jgi:hypothetical protein
VSAAFAYAADGTNEVFQDSRAMFGIHDFGMKLQAKDWLGRMSEGRARASVSRR